MALTAAQKEYIKSHPDLDETQLSKDTGLTVDQIKSFRVKNKDSRLRKQMTNNGITVMTPGVSEQLDEFNTKKKKKDIPEHIFKMREDDDIR